MRSKVCGLALAYSALAFGASDQEKAVQRHLLERQFELDQVILKQRQHQESIRRGGNGAGSHLLEQQRSREIQQRQLQSLEALPPSLEPQPSPSLQLKRLEIERATNQRELELERERSQPPLPARDSEKPLDRKEKR